MNVTKSTSVVAVGLALALAAASMAAEQPRIVDDPYEGVQVLDPSQVAPAARGYSPYAGRKYPTQVLWGDTHNHTSNSGDAFTAGNRLTPEDAYRVARGEEVVSSSGVPIKLSRPLDFLVVADHAEGLGLMQEVYKGNPAFVSDPTLAGWSKAMKEGGEAAAAAQNEVTKAQAMGTLPARSRTRRSSAR